MLQYHVRYYKPLPNMRRRSKSENCSLELWYFYFYILEVSLSISIPLKIYDLGIPRPEASSITFVIHLRVENMCLQKFRALLHNTWPFLMVNVIIWKIPFAKQTMHTLKHVHFHNSNKIHTTCNNLFFIYLHLCFSKVSPTQNNHSVPCSNSQANSIFRNLSDKNKWFFSD